MSDDIHQHFPVKQKKCLYLLVLLLKVLHNLQHIGMTLTMVKNFYFLKNFAPTPTKASLYDLEVK